MLYTIDKECSYKETERKRYNYAVEKIKRKVGAMTLLIHEAQISDEMKEKLKNKAIELITNLNY